jgi:CheY-like chemotaxis protein
VEIESQRGQGTVVRLLFPVCETQEAADPMASEPERPLPRQRILFVDDEPLVRQLVHDMLASDQHEVATADGGENALSQFREATAGGKPFDVVITDLGMPQIDGRKLAQLLKQESAVTPVIMLTGWGSFMRADGDTPLDVECVLSKPPRLSELRSALRKVTQDATALAPT